MSISGRIIEIFYNTATGSRIRRNIFTPLGALVFITFVTSFVAAAFYSDYLIDFPSVSVYPLNLIAGIPLITAGVLLSGYCIYFFLKSKGTPVPLNPPPKLITTGPYAYIRNPMLTGAFLQLFGFGILCDSFSLTFIFTPLLILINIIELKKIEEPELEKRLGEEYREYKKRVPMFFPKRQKR